MKIIDCVQRSEQWKKARAGIPTASDFDKLVTPKWKIKTGDGPRSYLRLKLWEARHGPIPEPFSFGALEQGTIKEEEALPWYTLETSEQVQRVGFCTTDDGRIGCSPDGLIGEDSGIEVKCPTGPVHLGYLIDGVLPEDYAAQVHGCMLVTGRASWRFLSYCRGEAPLLLTIKRDEEIQKVLRAALEAFLCDFDAAMGRLNVR